VADDPTMRRYGQALLRGSDCADDDGVPTARTVLVEKGTLKTLLASRNPVRGTNKSTGSRRGGTLGPGNLMVTVSGGLPEEEMKRKDHRP